MATPGLKVATDFVRLAVADFDLSWDHAVEFSLAARGLNLTDLHNALSCCEAKWSNKLEAEGVYLEVVGTTTDNVDIVIIVWINPDRQCLHVEKVS